MRNEEETTIENMSTSAAVVADLVARHMKPELVNVAPEDVEALGPEGSNRVPLLVLPKGLVAQSIKPFLDDYRTAPERRKGTARLVELESFIDHVNRFKDDDSALFALPSTHPGETSTLTAVFDYHRKNRIVPTSNDSDQVGEIADGAPRFGEHRAVYSFPASDEWIAWLGKNGKWLDQQQFAAHLEDHILGVADPQAAFTSAKEFASALGIPSFASPTRLLELSRGLTIHVDESVTNRIDPSTGETTMFFEQKHNDEKGAPLVVPRAFLLQIPVFRAGAAYQFAVRLRYRTGGGKVAWSYEIHGLDKAFTDAFREACDTARDGTMLPLFYGSPER